MDYGIWTIVPVLIVIVLAVATKSSFEPLIAGILAGCIIAYGSGFLDKFIEHLTTALTDANSGWVILVCMLYGSLITMMIRSGGTIAFSNLLLKRVNSRRSAMLSTWGLGLFLFIDDYLHSLALGAAMKKVTDRFRISREMLAYLVHATSAPLCILLPISTWSIFISKILEQNGVADKGQGMQAYILAIPYMLFGFIGIFVALLVAFGTIPSLWKMNHAEKRAEGGQTIPPDRSGIQPPEENIEVENGKVRHFFIPLTVLMATTIYFDLDALKGALITNFFTFIYFATSRALSLRQLSDSILSGFNTILFPIILVILAFALKLVNDDLHFVQYVINSVSPLMSKEFFPAIAFLTLAIIAFLTGSSWDLYVIAIPIIIPLAQSLDANVWMAISVVVGAGAFGSNAAFYSDSTILTAASTNIPTMTHGITQLPYTATVLGLTTLAYAIMGHLV